MVSDDLLQRSPTRVSGDIEDEETNLCLVGDLEEKIGIEALRVRTELTRIRFSNIKLRIRRFPVDLREFGRRMDYIVPRVVAIGPYHHRQPELQEMEEVKCMAAYSLCEELECSPDEVYGRIQPVARNARECYADVDALESFSGDDFAVMLFLDGCFLLQCLKALPDLLRFNINNNETLHNVISSKGLSNIMSDMMLLENQIPWPVLQLLIDLKPNVVPMEEIIGDMLTQFSKSLDRPRIVIDKNFRPPHLLGLVRFYQVGAIEVMERESFWPDWMRMAIRILRKEYNMDFSSVTSAAELAEIGVKLTPSETCRFSDMNLVRGPLLAKLSLPPIFLNDVTPCWLVNMAAFEQRAIIGDYAGDQLGVSSYLCVLSQLMNREDDVRELCNRGVLHSTHGHKQMLRFFTNVGPFLLTGQSHGIVLLRLPRYKNYRWILIAIYRFLYKKGRIIATVLSIAGVLVGIFIALLSLWNERH